MLRNVLMGLLVAILTPFSSTMYCQSCSSDDVLAENASSTNPPGGDGRTHVTYSFVDSSGNIVTPSANVSSAFNNAIAAWNALSSATGVQFSAAPPGTEADLQIQQTTYASGPRENVLHILHLEAGCTTVRRSFQQCRALV